jgi:hypothetical protein
MGIENVLSRRIWFVPGFEVWGLPGLGVIEYLVLENIGSEKTIFYGQAGIGDGSQTVAFNELTDHRGNILPANIDSPRVIARSHDENAVFIVGTEKNNSFKIAHDPYSKNNVTVDLMIIELGI